MAKIFATANEAQAQTFNKEMFVSTALRGIRSKYFKIFFERLVAAQVRLDFSAADRLIARRLMNSAELFRHLSPSLAHTIFEFLFTHDKASYKSALGTLAAQRKLRPVFLERKPKTERHVWMRDAIGRPQNEMIAANLIQMWLINARSSMLCDFLDHLGITHDGKGGIDTLPAAPAKEKLQEAIQALLEKYPREEVMLYLHAFQSMDIAGWPSLQEILDSELKFDAASPVAAA